MNSPGNLALAILIGTLPLTCAVIWHGSRVQGIEKRLSAISDDLDGIRENIWNHLLSMTGGIKLVR